MPGLATLRVDGGASANDLLCQLQADQVGVPVERPKLVETTALGAAFLAGLGTGVWSSTDDLRETWQLDKSFTPAEDRTAADAAHARWKDAVERSKGWAGTADPSPLEPGQPRGRGVPVTGGLGDRLLGLVAGVLGLPDARRRPRRRSRRARRSCA